MVCARLALFISNITNPTIHQKKKNQQFVLIHVWAGKGKFQELSPYQTYITHLIPSQKTSQNFQDQLKQMKVGLILLTD
jgi:hypothetical protein